ncbi:hypothetical protein VTL71DRAFT_8664 [Oculimacula yallundae]|uniref:Uncharacterized protein n=1 Tax=Oculimacula yallundae TaxID=86028 RepID=A0ABR4CYC6_9HELO
MAPIVVPMPDPTSQIVTRLPSNKDTVEEIEKSDIVAPQNVTSRIGFAIDIDGVLMKHPNKNQLPASGCAVYTSKTARPKNSIRPSHQSHVHFSRAWKLILRRTPFKFLLPQHKYKPVLAIGHRGTDTRWTAEHLGFQDVYVPKDFYEVYPDLTPKALSKKKYTNPGSRAENIRKGFSSNGVRVEIGAILIFGSGDTMYGPVEKLKAWSPNKLILQLLKSASGDLGDPTSFNGDKSSPDDNYQQSSAPKVFWDTGFNAYHDFRMSFEKAWERETGLDPELCRQYEVGGKPSETVFRYASMMLKRRQRELHGESAKRLEKIIMVGDTPKCDIKGVNYHKVSSDEEKIWKTVLVESGSWDKVDGFLDKWETPDVVVRGVEEAVRWGLETHGQTSEEIEATEDSKDSEEDSEDHTFSGFVIS